MPPQLGPVLKCRLAKIERVGIFVCHLLACSTRLRYVRITTLIFHPETASRRSTDKPSASQDLASEPWPPDAAKFPSSMHTSFRAGTPPSHEATPSQATTDHPICALHARWAVTSPARHRLRALRTATSASRRRGLPASRLTRKVGRNVPARHKLSQDPSLPENPNHVRPGNYDDRNARWAVERGYHETPLSHGAFKRLTVQ